MNAKTRSFLLSVLFVAALAYVAYYLNQPSPQPAGVNTRAEQTRATRAVERHAVDETIGFASHEKLVQHYRKHGNEFGAISMADYLRFAQHLRDRPAGATVLEFIRRDGVVSRFDRESGAFIAFNTDKTIRTLFKPNDGEAYFHRQKYKAQ
jgi:pyocin large subunit-like protein